MRCSSCHRTFTRARHFDSHRCQGGVGDYVHFRNWPIKNKVVTAQSDADEESDATYRLRDESGGELAEEGEMEDDSDAK